MMNKKKTLLNALFLILVFALTIYSIFHGQDMDELLMYIKQADLRYWAVSIVCVIFFIGSESVIIYYMMRSIQQKIRLGHCFLYSFVGFFWSCITPSATGGQPAQIYYMRKDKLSIPISTLVLMIVTITYKLVLVVIGLGVILFRPPVIMEYLKPVMGWCYLGIALNVFCVAFMMLLVFHPTMAKNMLKSLIRFLGRIHLMRRVDHYLDKVEQSMVQYQDVAVYFRTHKLVVANVFGITVVQRLLLFFVTYLTCRSFGIYTADMVTIVILQGMISVAVDMLPLPGGMGISEQLFLAIFLPICGTLTLPAMVVSRGLSYYTELIISAVMTVVAHLTIGRQKKEEKLQ
ncbi:MAG: flippase-like domain-containing protein [Lachnospiraceae bacterium]|nr:flippase-like domain-containing protein [Lachnospiraceae bacterium]MDE7434428.1 flippase-like domain-containing protein [Lachnospiraceae bacterium]